MFDWVWRTLGYELEKDIIREWSLNKMKVEKIKEELRLERLKTIRIAPELPIREKTKKKLSQKQIKQQKTYAGVTKESKVVNDE
tara:strand:+ start:864 stop:1115 length:252 start_codon:yes stop_codon:yes gene_type:complete